MSSEIARWAAEVSPGGRFLAHRLPVYYYRVMLPKCCQLVKLQTFQRKDFLDTILGSGRRSSVVEQRFRKPQVKGSNPLAGSILQVRNKPQEHSHGPSTFGFANILLTDSIWPASAQFKLSKIRTRRTGHEFVSPILKCLARDFFVELNRIVKLRIRSLIPKVERVFLQSRFAR